MLQANLNYPCNNPCKRKVSRKAFSLAGMNFFFNEFMCVDIYTFYIFTNIQQLLYHIIQNVLIPYQYFKTC